MTTPRSARALLLTFVLLTLGLSACGTPAATRDAASGADAGPCGAIVGASCNEMTTSAQMCSDFLGGSVWVAMAESSCAMRGGAWSTSPCPHAASLGGCRTTVACGDAVSWYYTGGPISDAASLMTNCNASVPDSYVAP